MLICIKIIHKDKKGKKYQFLKRIISLGCERKDFIKKFYINLFFPNFLSQKIMLKTDLYLTNTVLH